MGGGGSKFKNKFLTLKASKKIVTRTLEEGGGGSGGGGQSDLRLLSTQDIRLT